MTQKWKDIAMRQILTIITTIATALIILAFKAPYMFKKKVEFELSKKADIEMVDKALATKVDRTTYDSHLSQQESKYENIERLLEAQKDQLKLAVDLLKDRR